MIHIIDLKFLGKEQVIAAFLVETSAGIVLVESGPHSTYDTLIKGVQSLGYDPEEIKHVFLTHIHFDHAGAAWAFAEKGATIYVHERGAKHLINPERLVSSAKLIYQDMMDSLWGSMNPIPAEQVKIVNDKDSFLVGDTTFTAHYTPGHAVHHIAWQLDKTLFSGDVGGIKIGEGPSMPPCPPPDINIEDWQTSLKRIRELDLETMYLTHYGKVTTIATHLKHLEERLLSWANWMKTHYEKNTPQAEIVPKFQALVQEDLKENGITDEDELAQYEAANPSFMAVAGLMRYWKKKNQNS